MCIQLDLDVYELGGEGLPKAYLTLSKEDRLKVYSYLTNIDKKLSMGEVLTDEEIRQTKEYTSKYCWAL